MSDTTSTREKDTASQKLRLLGAGLLFGALVCLAFGVAQAHPHGVAQAHPHGVAHAHHGTSRLPPQVVSDKLATLRAWSARLYTLEDGLNAGYNTLINNPLTAPDGCISLNGAGGMGYHYTIAREDGSLPLMDDEVHLLEPELLIYFPRGVTQEEFNTMTPEQRTSHMKLVGFDYFIPYSPATPSPEDGGEPPTFDELGGLPFMPSRFGGWMLHIWLWRDNPAGMFANWNPALPTCVDSPF